MGKNVAQKLIDLHLVEGKAFPGEEIGIRIDQTLTQDATGTLVMLELEAMGLQRVKTELSVQYVDHNLLQTDFKNAEDHLFLQSACQRFGVWYSGPGNGVSHPVHMERFGIPGKSLLGSDSHTPAAGALGMLAIGAGGLEVALAMAGSPFHFMMPKIRGIKLVGELPEWVSAKDIILEMLRRHNVNGGVGKIFEYHGPGLEQLSAMDRHVIANMGAELGATTSVFPSDERVREFLKMQGREQDWRPIHPDHHCSYDEEEEIDLSKLEPLIACPSSPGNVVTVRSVAGKEVYQCMIGSSANPGFSDFAIAAMIVDGKKVHPRVSFDINPTSRQILENLTEEGYLSMLIRAGGRIHQAGCNGCIGMGQAPANEKISLRTVPRNFPGRSGTKEDLVYLCSPATAAASALTGVITDPRRLGMSAPAIRVPESFSINLQMVEPPPADGSMTALVKGSNIRQLPEFEPLPDSMTGPVLIKVGDHISTDEIMPAGSRVLPFRSNIPEISKFTFQPIDETYYERAMEHQKEGHFIVAGTNYGQGSSREHAAIAPHYLGVRAVLAKSFARIHRQNLVNFGILPLIFLETEDYSKIDKGDYLLFDHLLTALQPDVEITVYNQTKGESYRVKHAMTPREIEMVKEGGIISIYKHHLVLH